MIRLEYLEVSEQIVNQDEATQSSLPPETEQVKRIEDFDVMKKYLQTGHEKKITVEVMDQDEAGNKTRSETFIVSELVAQNNS